jgi:hypothetical protein
MKRRALFIVLTVLLPIMIALGALSYWYPIPAGAIWIEPSNVTPHWSAALVSGVLHVVHAHPRPPLIGPGRDDNLVGCYIRSVVIGQTEAIGFGGPIWYPAGLVLAIWIVAFLRVLRRWRWRRQGRCLHCGYNLIGTIEPRCPECGQAFVPRAALPARG